MSKRIERIRIGVIGAGAVAFDCHFPVLAELAQEGMCELVEVCDLDIESAKRAARDFLFTSFTHDAEKLIAREDIDVVYIFGPADVHYRFGLEALRSGKHLFVEKPPAQNSFQLRELIDEATRRDLVAVAGFNRRFEHPLLQIKERIGDGEAITTAEVMFHKPTAGAPPPYGMKSWLGANGIHALDALCFLMGERPTVLYAADVKIGQTAVDTSALIVWKGGRHALFSTNHEAGSRTERYVFHTHSTTFEAESRKFTSVTGGAAKVQMYAADLQTRGFVDEHRVFLDAILGKTEPPHSLRSTSDSLFLVELIENGHCGLIEWPSFSQAQMPTAPSPPQETARKERPMLKEASILVLNPSHMKTELPRLAERFSLVYEDSINGLPVAQTRATVVAAVTGGPGGKPLTPELIKMFPNISVLAVAGASVGRFGGEAAIAYGIPIINTADVYAKTVAEFVVMQALVGIRSASRSHDIIRRGGWGFKDKDSFFVRMVRILKRSMSLIVSKAVKARLHTLMKSSPAISARWVGKNLRGRTIGIIGFGEITKQAVPLFQAHGSRVLVCSEYLSEAEAERIGIEKATNSEALTSDIVILLRGLSERTSRSFGRAEVEAMRPGTVFINSARAGLVDTKALLERLRRGDIFACLDVFDAEPLSPRDPFRALPNVFLTSHLAGATQQMLVEARSALVDKVCAYLDGGEVPDIIATRNKLDNMT